MTKWHIVIGHNVTKRQFLYGGKKENFFLSVFFYLENRGLLVFYIRYPFWHDTCKCNNEHK